MISKFWSTLNVDLKTYLYKQVKLFRLLISFLHLISTLYVWEIMKRAISNEDIVSQNQNESNRWEKLLNRSQLNAETIGVYYHHLSKETVSI